MHRRRPGHRLGLGAALRLLVLGGTAFLGRHVVEAALNRDYEVTIFNRGQTKPGLFSGVEELVGDRNGELSALRGRTWEACVDPSAYLPRQVRASAEILKDAVEHYAFISSGSVYALDGPKSEDSPVLSLEDPDSEDVTRDYGALKAVCERVSVEEFGESRVLNVRSGLIVGPWDPTNRFTFWPLRVARGGEVLAPSSPDYQVQFIHARDQAEWILDCAERGLSGTFNCTGPEKPLTLGDFLGACREVAGSDATFTWVPDDFLLQHQVGPWNELPLWLPSGDGTLFDMPNARAIGEGLTFRPVEQTIAETLAWARSQGAAHAPVDSTGRVRPQAGIDPDKERRVLDAWHSDPR